MNPTQKDIAKALGVSVSLVSRALSGNGSRIGASARTIKRIQDSAKSLGYVPSIAARSLRGGPTRTVGVVVFDFDDPFFNTVISLIQEEAHRRRLSTVLVGFEHRKVESKNTEPLFRYRLDSVIVVGSGPLDFWIDPFLSNGINVIQIGGGLALPGIIQVTVDNAKGMALIAHHLLGKGHRRFGFVGPETVVSRERLQMLGMELAKKGIGCSDLIEGIIDAPVSESGYRACLKIVKKCDGCLPTAIVAASDAVAIGVLRALHEVGLGVPSNISLTGFDDIVAARLSVPSLTTVKHPMKEIVGKAMELASARSTVRRSNSSLFTEPVLLVRESTAPVKSSIIVGKSWII